MQLEFATATRIVFGEGALREAAPAAAAMGRRALVVTGASQERAAGLTRSLEAEGLVCMPFAVSGEPTVDLIRAGAEFARAGACDVVVAIGGGSAIDAGKALAAMLTNPGDPLDYLEVIGRGQPLTQPSAPFIAIPTTAGTGSEVTRNAVLASPEQRVKASLRSAGMLPRLAVVDPELTLGLAARAHRLHRSRCPHATDRAVRVREGERHDGSLLRGRHPPCREGPASRMGRMAATAPRAAIWRGPACSAACRWPTQGSARCTALPRRSAECGRLRTARSARRCCRTQWKSTLKRCVESAGQPGTRNAMTKSDACSPASRTRQPTTPSGGPPRSAAGSKSLRSAPME